MGFFSSVKSFASGFNVEHFKKIISDLAKVFANFKKTYDKFTGVFTAAQHLFDSTVGEIDAWKHFKQDIRIKQRVVNLETAIKKTRELIEGIPSSWRAVLDVFKQIRSAIQKDVIAEEGAALLAVETAGLSEVVVGLTIIYQVLSFVTSIIEDLQTIVDELQRLRLEIEKLDTVFLSQSNKRKTVKLASGKTMKVRIGHLHHFS
jgi:hypothetical protein